MDIGFKENALLAGLIVCLTTVVAAVAITNVIVDGNVRKAEYAKIKR